MQTAKFNLLESSYLFLNRHNIRDAIHTATYITNSFSDTYHLNLLTVYVKQTHFIREQSPERAAKGAELLVAFFIDLRSPNRLALQKTLCHNRKILNFTNSIIVFFKNVLICWRWCVFTKVRKNFLG